MPRAAAISFALRPLRSTAREILAEISFFFKFLLAIYFPLCLTLSVPAHKVRANYTKKAMNTQVETIDKSWLNLRGYTVAAAARRIGRSCSHVNRVLNGKRESESIKNALRRLPLRRMVWREKLPH